MSLRWSEGRLLAVDMLLAALLAASTIAWAEHYHPGDGSPFRRC